MPRTDQKLIPFALLALGLVLTTALGANLANERSATPVSTAALADRIPPWREWLADWAYVQADVYFLRGTAPGLFNRLFQPEEAAPCPASFDGTHAHGDAPARDWLEAFGRDFHVHQHTHLGGTGGDNTPLDNQARELLPWLRLAVELNPRHVEAYLLGAHLLRRSLHRNAEAEQFLQEALRHNPGHHEIHFALGQLAEEHHHDTARARVHWQRALRDWQARDPERTTPLAFRRIVGSLARLEERAGRLTEALSHLERLLSVTPDAVALQQWAAMLRETIRNPQMPTSDGAENQPCTALPVSDLIGQP